MSTPALPRDFEILREVGHVTETCAYGDEHKVTYYESQYVSPTGETREYDNGYTQEQTNLVADRSGRVYHARPPTDFYGKMVWLRDGDNARFTSSTVSGAARYTFGKSIQNCPDGPKWSEVTDAVVTNETAAESALRALGLDITPENIARVTSLKDEPGDRP